MRRATPLSSVCYSTKPFILVIAALAVVGCIVLIIEIWHPSTVMSRMLPSKAVRKTTFEKDAGPMFVSYGRADAKLVSHLFQVPNTSRAVWKPKLVGSSCGCVSVNVEPNEVPPNGILKVQMSFRPGYARREQVERAVVSTGAGELAFVLRASVFPIVWPERIGRELTLESDCAEVATRRVYISTYLPLSSDNSGKRLSCSTDGVFSVRLLPIAQERIGDLAVHERYEARITYAGKVLQRGQTVTDVLRWKLGDAELDTSISASRLAVITASPNSLFVNGTSKMIHSALTISGKEEFSVIAVTSSNSMLRVHTQTSVPTGQSTSHVLDLVLSLESTRETTDTWKCDVIVETDDDAQPFVRVPVWVLES